MGSERHKEGPPRSQKERPRSALRAVLWEGWARREEGGAGNKPQHFTKEREAGKHCTRRLQAPGRGATSSLPGEKGATGRVRWGSVPPENGTVLTLWILQSLPRCRRWKEWQAWAAARTQWRLLLMSPSPMGRRRREGDRSERSFWFSQ